MAEPTAPKTKDTWAINSPTAAYFAILRNLLYEDLYSGKLAGEDIQQILYQALQQLQQSGLTAGLPRYAEIRKAYPEVFEAPDILTPAERRRLEMLPLEREAREQWEAQRPYAIEESRRETARLQSLWEREKGGGWSVETERAASEKGFEAGRQAALSGFNRGPSDWINIWQAQNMPNPYIREPQSPYAEAEADVPRLKGEFEHLLSVAENLATDPKYSDPEYGGTFWGQGGPAESFLEAAYKSSKAWSAAEEKLKTMEQSYAPPQAPRPTAPPAPGWLSEFAPGQITGQPITKAPVTTPSGQLWAKTPWSVQEGLAGYTQWAGGRPYKDIMSQMEAMRTRTPYGAGRTGWSPARQMA